MQRIQLQFFQVSVYVESDWSEIMELLRKDFWSFLSSDSPYAAGSSLSLTLLQSDQKPLFPSRVASMQTQDAVTFDEEDHRYCDYYGELFSVINFTKNKAVLYSTNLEKMHEVTRLLILSRVGKLLDMQGLHKLQAFAVAYKEQTLVCMMPKKGGKSALLKELLQDTEIKLLAEDYPLIDFKGRVYPFLMTLDLKDKIVKNDNSFEKVVLVQAFLANTPTSILKKATGLQMFKGLFKHGIIGYGSPIAIEYFWEFGSKDFWLKTFIFLRRLKAFMSLNYHAKKYRLYAGNDPKKTAQDLTRILKRY